MKQTKQQRSIRPWLYPIVPFALLMIAWHIKVIESFCSQYQAVADAYNGEFLWGLTRYHLWDTPVAGLSSPQCSVSSEALNITCMQSNTLSAIFRSPISARMLDPQLGP